MATVYEDKYGLNVGDIKSLAEFEGVKFSGILIKKNIKDYSYLIKYRNEVKKVIKKVIKEKNMTKRKALTALNKAKNDVLNLKDGISPIKEANKNKLTNINEMADYYFINNPTKSSEKERRRYNFHIEGRDFASKYIFLITTDELENFIKILSKTEPNHLERTKRKKETEANHLEKTKQKKETEPNHTEKTKQKKDDDNKNEIFYKNKFLSPKSINIIIDLCKTVINYSIKKGKYKGENPFANLDKPPVNNVKLKLMNDDEMKLYFKALENADIRYARDIDEFKKKPYRISLLFALLALTTGARVQTILNIKIRDIDFNDNIIHLLNKKVNDKLYIGHIASDSIKEIIKEIINNNGYPNREYLFCVYETEKKYVNYPNPVKNILDKTININRSGDSILTVRDLRNVFATNLINKKVPLSSIQNLLNHTTPNMTVRYAQMLEKTGGDDVKQHLGNIF